MELYLVLVLLAFSEAGPAARQLDSLTKSRYEKIDYPGCGQRRVLSDNGVNELNTRIVGGFESVPYSWPGIVSIYTSYKIDNCCFHFSLYYSNRRASAYVAYCGIHDRTTVAQPNRVIIYFSELYVHSLYNSNTLDYDISIFKVMTALPTNNYIDAVCLPNENWNVGEKAIVAGWGTLSSGGVSPTKLNQVTKPIKSRETCRLRYGTSAITLRMLCAGLPEGGIDSCQGDSGGPLYSYRFGRWTLTGIVSWGYGCAQQLRPGVYTDVIELKDWINGIINL
uniref:Peptidase S1 domain-containing protein n=1 Tax=Biomphalaria glabrata TaxID=6526 RepID=A0A2C9K9E3_BIOGL